MSSTRPSAQKTAEFEGAAPILRVRDLRVRIEHYLEVLGFKVDWIGVTDASALHDEYRSKGAKVHHQPTNYPWAYEMQVEDPDGNVLRLGSEPRAGVPVGE